ncbi:uncharacterized protein PAE49_010501 [Odontesthes bonariensis]|uniref:uncharacterized protein LOC142388901 n=1 Tax=Odontesthes bonariensis TaxID=219752 RepID=UPI003F58573E
MTLREVKTGFIVPLITLFKMLTMKADKWVFLLPLWLTCVSSNNEHLFEECNMSEQLSAPLGSSVLIPCKFSTQIDHWVEWSQGSKMNKMNKMVDVVKLSANGRVKFLDPRDGRVKAFPIQASRGNYSISIYDLQDTDLGSYRCKLRNDCFKVELSANESTLTKDMLIYICVGVVGALILLSVLSVGSYCCYKKCTSDANYPVSSSIEGASAPPLETGRVDEHHIGAHVNNLVYENDDQYLAHADPNRDRGGLPGDLQDPGMSQPGPSTSGIYPNLDEFRFERAESQRTKQRFHTELFSRLRQASLNRHFYVNQRELRKQHAMAKQAENDRAGLGRKKAKDNCDYKNPIYNRSTDQLDRL